MISMNPHDWPITAFFRPKRRVPQLEADEAVVAHALLAANGVALLTDRRLVIASVRGERSVALSAMGAIEVGFERSTGDFAKGVALVGLALFLFGISGYLSGALAGHAGAIDGVLRAEGGDGGVFGGIAGLAQRILNFAAAGVRWFPWLAILFLAWGGIRLARGFKGSTEVNIVTPMGEYRLYRFGKSEELDLLGRALARRFAAPRVNFAEAPPALPRPK